MVNADDGAVDEHIFEVRFLRENLEQLFENPLLRPAAKALENRIPLTEDRWNIASRRSRSHPPQNGFQKQPVVRRRNAAIRGLARKMR